MKIKSFRELEIWKLGKMIVEDTYKTTKSFPDDERFGLTAQMRRCSVSIPSNIAEGFMRNYTKEYSQFLHIALGSCAELDTQVIIAHRRRFLSEVQFEELAEFINHESRMISSLINKL